MRFVRLFGIFLGLSGLLQAGFGQEVVVYTSVDQVFSEPVFQAYEKRTGVDVVGVFDTEETKSAGIVNRLIAEKNRPRADVFFSGDPMRCVVLKNEGILTPYRSPQAKGLPAQYQDKDQTFTGFSSRARIILVNTNLVPGERSVLGLGDFIKPEWAGKTAIANPLFGTTSFHVAALFSIWGREKTEKYLGALKENGCRIVSSNGEVRRQVTRGDVAFGLADTDDANMALLEDAPVRIVFPDQDTSGEYGGFGTLLVPSAACLIKEAPHTEEAKKFIDYLLSPEVERMLAELECAQIPLRQGVRPPENLPALDGLKKMDVDLVETANRIETVLPWLREWSRP